MRQFCWLALLILAGCGKSDAPTASAPTTQTAAPQPAAPSLRPRFRDGLEAFVTEATVLTNLPSTGASVKDMTEQRDKVQQAFARMSEPQDEKEKTLHAGAKQFTVNTLALVEMHRLYHQALGLGGDVANQAKQTVDETVADLKTNLRTFEDALDK